MSASLPSKIESEAQLDELLSEPTEQVMQSLSKVSGDVILLGAGGKMGLSLARMARRATEQIDPSRKILAVSRFGQPAVRNQFEQHGIDTLAGDLLDEAFLSSLPRYPNVIFMAGMKFGTGSQSALTWAMNTYLPALVCRHFADSRFVAFSTGNVYPFVPIQSGGSVESDALAPIGEYAMSALGRERIFEYFSRRDKQPVSIVRLNYAVEMRYGVLVDLARQVLDGEEAIDLSTGHVNVIWQGDANAHTLCSLPDAASPPNIVNVAGPEIVNVRDICERFGKQFDREPKFVNQSAETALLNNAQRSHSLYGKPIVSLEQLSDWVVEWLKQGGKLLGKPTHFQTRDGRF